MDALRQQAARRLTAIDLANIRDFRLGEATVSPSRRIVAGPGGTATLEPRVMQVLVALSQDAGDVVSRETLFDRCWGGVYVGDDSLNRAILAVRKLASGIGDRSFEIETIPKTGYRLTGAEPAALPPGESTVRLSRRRVISATAGVLAVSGFGAWRALESANERRFEQLLLDGDQALAGDDTQFKPDKALRSFGAAVRIQPNSARALGRLALAQSYFALYASPQKSPVATVSAAHTAQEALAINRREPNALLAMFELQGSTLDWWTRDQRLREIIAIDASNGSAIFDLSSLLQATGLCGESWKWNERNIRITPLSLNCLSKRALKLWIFGRLPDAENVINQLRAQYPNSDWVWTVRFLLYALTDRPRAARTMLESRAALLRAGPASVMWRSCLEALDVRSAYNLAKARKACLDLAPGSGDLSGQAVMAMSALGEVDSAFEIANGYLLSRDGFLPRSKEPYGRDPSDAAVRINTAWLFMPPCKNMRADKRFLVLCERVGLLEYWSRRGVQPDYMRLDRQQHGSR